MKCFFGLAVLALVLCLQLFDVTSASATQGELNKAGVVIDTGSEVKTVCITFKGDSITGAQALELANAQPVFQSFSGIGQAVCSLCGVGCPSGSTCLTCMGAKFWNYFNAPNGSNSFSLSRAGAGSSIVKPGDIQGWKFGVGQKPPFLSFNTICGIEIDQETQAMEPSISGSEVEEKTSPSLIKSENQVVRTGSESTVEVTPSAPVNILGKQEARKIEAFRSKNVESDESKVNTNVIGLLLVLLGLIPLGFLLYKASRWNKEKQQLI